MGGDSSKVLSFFFFVQTVCSVLSLLQVFLPVQQQHLVLWLLFPAVSSTRWFSTDFSFQLPQALSKWRTVTIRSSSVLAGRSRAFSHVSPHLLRLSGAHIKKIAMTQDRNGPKLPAKQLAILGKLHMHTRLVSSHFIRNGTAQGP